MEPNSKITGRFEKIAVAISFSSRIEGVIAEAVRFAKSLEAELFFIHITGQKDDNVALLHQLIRKHTLDLPKHQVIVGSGNVVNTLMKITRENNIELLIAGALENESYLKYYLGSISRK